MSWLHYAPRMYKTDFTEKNIDHTNFISSHRALIHLSAQTLQESIPKVTYYHILKYIFLSLSYHTPQRNHIELVYISHVVPGLLNF